MKTEGSLYWLEVAVLQDDSLAFWSLGSPEGQEKGGTLSGLAVGKLSFLFFSISWGLFRSQAVLEKDLIDDLIFITAYEGYTKVIFIL